MFKECLDSCGIVDLGFHGPKFTSVYKREVGHFIQERLDRGFANIDWRDLYFEAIVHHLAYTHSNHCPVLLNLDTPPPFKPLLTFPLSTCLDVSSPVSKDCQ